MKSLIFALVALSVCGAAHAQEPLVQAKLRISTEEADFLVSVDRAVVKGQEGPGRIRIACVRGCLSPIYFEEHDDDAILGLFQPDDTNALLVTTWVTGSAYAVRVYRLSKTGIQKVLDEHSLAPVSFDESQRLTIRTVPSNGGHPSKRQLWSWNGRAFRLSGPGH